MDVQSFSSFEEMQQAMTQATDLANSQLHPKQRDLGWGDYFIVFRPEDHIVIFGYCMTQQELHDAELRAGAEHGELEEVMADMTAAHQRGFLFGQHYSVMEPQGELGSTHSIKAWPIPKSLFDAAREVHWDPDEMSEQLLAQIDAVYQELRAHALTVLEGGDDDGTTHDG